MSYTVTSDKPIPTKSSTVGKRKYPFFEMGIGDSFFVPYPQAEKAYATARSHGHYHGKKFRVLKESHEGHEGLRIWRIR